MSQSRILHRWSRQILGGLRRLTAAELVVWSSWIGLLSSVESLGRRFDSEWFDLGAGLTLLAWLTATVVVHHARPLSVVAAVVGLFPEKKWWRRLLSLDWGVDLRRAPPIRRALPAIWKRIALAIAALTVAIPVAAVGIPAGTRAWLVSRFYLAYLLPWTLVLGTSLFLMTVLLFLVWAEIHDQAVTSFDGQGRRPVRREVLAMATCSAALLAAGALFPAWIPLTGMLLILAVVSAGLWLTSSDLVLVWRQEHRGRHGCFDGRLFIWFQAAAIICLLSDLVLLMGGTHELPGVGDWHFVPMVSDGRVLEPARILARILAWLSLGGTVAVGIDALRLAMQGIRFHPGRMAKAEGRTLSPAASFEVRRPVEIRCRRKLLRGFERLFKRVARRKLPSNSGLLIGLQHWFVQGLRSDAAEDYLTDRDATVFDGIIGRPFHRVFPRLARFHYWQMTTALEIDLIYVERSVSFRRFVRVLRQIYEIYDMHGGTVRAEDRHFLGLPGVKVIIHDVDAGTIQPSDVTPPDQAGYPEPEFRELDRARVLHVFRDRQESEVDDPVPTESNWAPDVSFI